MVKFKVMLIFGTRPEAIKMAPLIKMLKSNSSFQVITVVTAQHREMLDQVLTLFNLQADYDLNIIAKNQSLTGITIKVLSGIEQILKKDHPDLVLVHGDTSTTFAGSLASFYQKIPIGHVEAGLRTYHKYSPYPEELNRKLTSCLADLHFAPTRTAGANLLKEGVPPERIYITGNTVIDALLQVVKTDYQFPDPFLRQFDFKSQKLILVTAHRRENIGQPMFNIFQALREIVRTNPEVMVIYPVHKNPEVRKIANDALGSCERVYLIEPLEYGPFVNLMAQSYLVMTDSGGIQEEAPAFGKPVLVLRDTTERPEAVEAGTVRLAGTDPGAIFAAANQLINNKRQYEKMAKAINPYGDGRASERIVEGILNYFGLPAT